MRRALLLIVCFLACAAHAAGDAATGKTLFAPCAACHGANAEGNGAVNAPALAGQDAAYLARQLGNFRSGLRGADPADTNGAQMRAMAATLADEQAIADVAAFAASLPAPASKGEVAGDLRNGNNYYQGKCGACHGGKAEGNASLSAPRLAGQDPAYLRRQFEAFQKGVRGKDQADKYGRQMAMMAATLPTAQDLSDVLAFVHAQGQAAP